MLNGTCKAGRLDSVKGSPAKQDRRDFSSRGFAGPARFLRMHAAIHMFAGIWQVFQPVQQTLHSGLQVSAQVAQSWPRLLLQSLLRRQICKRRLEFRADCGEITCRRRFATVYAHAGLRMADVLKTSNQ